MSPEFQLGLIGLPLTHSLSPQIHQQFASQFALAIEYQKYSLPADELRSFIKNFFNQGGKGLNVTLPYKQAVIPYLDELSERARLAGSVNTLLLKQGKLVGDTTDGEGLIKDLSRLGYSVNGKNILLVGAGGAAPAVIVALLNAGAKLLLANRSSAKIQPLVERFSTIGNIAPYHKGIRIDGLVSSVSEFNPNLFAEFKSDLQPSSFIYDLNYGDRADGCRNFALAHSCESFADGWGMLVGQAAASFELWTGKRPNLELVLDKSIR